MPDDELLLCARDEMVAAGVEVLTGHIGDCLCADQIVLEIFVAMRKVELAQPGDD
jgi:hypothetical protein